jgi:hypothetical protein
MPEDRALYTKTEEAARLQQIGLRKDEYPVPPWE